MIEFVGFARWVTFTNENTRILHKAKEDCIIKYLTEQAEKGKDITNKNDEELKKGVELCFKGYLPPVDKDNELAAWLYIKQVAQKNLDNFPNSLTEDMEMIKQDDKDGKLGFNKKNCIVFRMQEK